MRVPQDGQVMSGVRLWISCGLTSLRWLFLKAMNFVRIRIGEVLESFWEAPRSRRLVRNPQPVCDLFTIVDSVWTDLVVGVVADRAGDLHARRRVASHSEATRVMDFFRLRIS